MTSWSKSLNWLEKNQNKEHVQVTFTHQSIFEMMNGYWLLLKNKEALSLAWNRDSETLSGATMIDPLNEGRREEFIFSFAKKPETTVELICGGLLHHPIKLITFAFEFCPLRKHKLSFWWLWWAPSATLSTCRVQCNQMRQLLLFISILHFSPKLTDHVVVYLICSSFKYIALLLLLLLYMCNIWLDSNVSWE